jgi:hypothetical protein
MAFKLTIVAHKATKDILSNFLYNLMLFLCNLNGIAKLIKKHFATNVLIALGKF